MGSAGGWTNYLTIDAMGRTLKLEQKAADHAVKTLEYTYATNGFVKSMKYPSGLTVTQTQTGAGRTASVAGSNGAAYAGSVTYGAGGMMTRAVLNGVGANSLEETRVFNSLGQMTVQDVRKGGSAGLSKWKVINDYGTTGNNGNLLKQSTDTGTTIYGVKFAYDAANRIRGAAENAPGEANLETATCSTVGGTWCVKYQVDAFGNAWTENKSASAGGLLPSSSSWFNASNRMNNVAYYANGNQKQWEVNDATTVAQFDAEGRMVKAGRVSPCPPQPPACPVPNWDLTQPLVTMTYNGLGQRVRKLVQQNGSSVASTYWVYGLDAEMVAEWESGAVGTGRQFLLSDHLGSTRVRLDANGEVLQRLDYEPYGVEVQRAGVSGYGGGNEVKQKYTGKERDAEIGLDYFGARFMASGLGRFTRPDPGSASASLYDPQSWNAYSYVENNPLTYVDRDGRLPLLAITGAGGALIGGAGAAAVEYLAQRGLPPDQRESGKIWTAFGGGFVAGGIAGLTLGSVAASGAAVGVGTTMLAEGAGSVVGGVLQRTADEKLGYSAPPTSELREIAVDAVSGGFAGAVGGGLGEYLVPLPNIRAQQKIIAHASRRSTREGKKAIANKEFERRAIVNTMAGETFENAFAPLAKLATSWLFGLFTDKKPSVETIFHPFGGCLSDNSRPGCQ